MRRLVAILTILAAGWWIAADLPAVDLAPPARSILITDRHGEPLHDAPVDSVRSHPVPLDAIAPILVEATIATEDARFWQHPGVDPIAIGSAAIATLRGEPRGGSTIAMQLVRARGPGDDWLVRRKWRELLLALALERRYSKNDILTAYLNQVPYGNRAMGIEAASQAYFGKPASQLSLSEATLLAGLPQAPGRLDPRADLAAARGRQRVVLDRLVQTGRVSADEANRAMAEPVAFVPEADPVSAPHAVLGNRARLVQTAIDARGARVTLTLDAGLQRLAEAILRRRLADLADRGVGNAALVAIDPKSGEILALAGSADYFDAGIDGAVNVATALRQPGSAIKPITYAAAFERGYGPASVLADVRTVFATRTGEPYIPVNYDHEYHGPLSLRVALASSINVVAVALLDRIGVPALVETGRSFGLAWDRPDRYDLALTLGGGEVSLLNLTAAYAALANGGQYRPPTDVRSVQAADGRTLWAAPAAPARQVVSPATAYLISDILRDPQARDLGFGTGSVLELSRPAAVKTGTTSNFRDNWTIGYTPDLVVGVWVGNADGASMVNVSGISGAAPIWHEFIEAALKDTPPTPFLAPAGIQWAEVCATDGLLATPLCPVRRTEPFASALPETASTSYQAVRIDGATGLLAASGCRGPVLTRVLWQPPVDLRGWAVAAGVPVVPEGRCDGAPVATAGSAIFAPDDGATFRLSRRLPADSQRLRVVISGGTASIDDEPVAADGWWTLRPGVHTLRVETSAGPLIRRFTVLPEE